MAIITVTDVPGWPNVADGLFQSCMAALKAAGFTQYLEIAPDGLHVSDAATVQSAMASYAGSAGELAFNKVKKQATLDSVFDANFDLAKFIRGGTAANITAANVGNFLATITNNYRSLRASITAAANMTVLNSININSGWPSNP